MQSIKFLGNGSGFTNKHTNAYFETDDNFIIIDISMINLDKLLSLKPYEKNTFVFITHMHDDHISGLSLLIQYYFYIYKKTINLVFPKELEEDILTDLKIKGVSKNIYNYILSENFKSPYFVKSIKTTHAPELNKKCFGYEFNINNIHCVYSGDTNTLEPYINKLKPNTEFYVDISASYGSVHLKYDDIKDKLLELVNNNVNIYIMHIDDEIKMRELIKNTKINIAEITNELLLG